MKKWKEKENINDKNKNIKIQKDPNTKYFISGDVIINEKMEAKKIKKSSPHILKIC